MNGWLITSRPPKVGHHNPWGPMGEDEHAARRTRRADVDSVQLVRACLLLAGGGSILAALLAVGRLVQLDSLLVISKTIFNIIAGLKQIGDGAVLLLLGLAQALGLFALSFAAMLSVLAMATGLLRLLAHVMPGLGHAWNGMAQGLPAIIALLGGPAALDAPSPRKTRGLVPLAGGRRLRSSAVRMRQAS